MVAHPTKNQRKNQTHSKIASHGIRRQIIKVVISKKCHCHATELVVRALRVRMTVTVKTRTKCLRSRRSQEPPRAPGRGTPGP